MIHMPISHKTLQSANPDRLSLDAASALTLALRFLRTNSAADSRQRRGTRDYLIGLFKLPFCNACDKIWNIDSNGTAIYARLVFTIQTALCLIDGSRFIIAKRNFLKVFIPNKRLLRGHRMFFGIHIELGHIRTPPS